jgi:type IV secretory pathway TrbF-like protein
MALNRMPSRPEDMEGARTGQGMSRLPPDSPEGPRYFERFAAPLLARNRLFLLLLMESVALIVLGTAFLSQAPDGRRVPYLVREHASGRVTVRSLGKLSFTPGHNSLRYFLGRWTIRLLGLNPALTARNLAADYEWTRGAAVGQFTHWVRETTPLSTLARHPDRVRTVRLESLSFLPGNVALIRCRTTRRSNRSGAVQRTEWVLTLNYLIVPPRTSSAVLRDPIGLFITNFNIQRNW